MANRYGEAALMAARRGPPTDIDPMARWESAMKQLYPTSATAQRKACPRGAFLGLCEEGLVRGIPPGHYTTRQTTRVMQSVPPRCWLKEGKVGQQVRCGRR